METRLPELPTWLFQIHEKSPHIYRLTGKDELSGASVDLTGPNPEELLREAESAVKRINAAIARKFD